jgi:hypothetical protein
LVNLALSALIDQVYKSEHTDTVVYSPEGALSYRLIAEHVEYFSEQEGIKGGHHRIGEPRYFLFGKVFDMLGYQTIAQRAFTRRWVIILLSLVALILIGLNLASTDDTATVAVNPKVAVSSVLARFRPIRINATSDSKMITQRLVLLILI